MRVLHLPFNIASQLSVTVQALRKLGIEARGLVTSNSAIQDPSGIEILPEALSRRQHPFLGSWRYWRTKRAVLDAIRWADVIHWHYSWALSNAADVRYAATLKKPGIVEFWGSDIRIPRIAIEDNPYRAQLCRTFSEFSHSAETRSIKKQSLFARYGVACLIPGEELLPYVDHKVYPSPYRTRQRISIDDFQALYPDPSRCKPLLVHMPSDKAKKGTDAVLKAIDLLKKDYEFEFKLIHGVARSEALAILKEADILLDQFVAGAHGLATLEAMAFGKPTICYIKPSLLPKFPPDCPIINANQDNLADILKPLLEDGHRRYEIGRASRAYVEKYHDSRELAKQLIDVYGELIAKYFDSTST